MATRLQLRTNARSRADQDTSTFPTDAQYNEYIDKGASRVYRRLVALGWAPTLTTTTITANGAASYSVGTDVMTLRHVAYQVSASYLFPLRRLNTDEVVGLTGQVGQALGYIPTGGVTQATSVVLLPKPSSGTYLVTYIPRFAGFSADADNWYGPDGSDECIILEAAREGAAKENDQQKVQILEASLLRAWDDVIQSADWLTQQHPGTVRDVNGLSGITDAYNWNAQEAWY